MTSARNTNELRILGMYHKRPKLYTWEMRQMYIVAEGHNLEIFIGKVFHLPIWTSLIFSSQRWPFYPFFFYYFLVKFNPSHFSTCWTTWSNRVTFAWTQRQRWPNTKQCCESLHSSCCQRVDSTERLNLTFTQSDPTMITTSFQILLTQFSFMLYHLTPFPLCILSSSTHLHFLPLPTPPLLFYPHYLLSVPLHLSAIPLCGPVVLSLPPIPRQRCQDFTLRMNFAWFLVCAVRFSLLIWFFPLIRVLC